jgi:hypothetical protein
MKLMYPARLGPETRCPYCKGKIFPIGGGSLFNCQNSHLVECVVMVTLNKADAFQEKKAEQTVAPSKPYIQQNITTDEPILPPKPGKTN